MATTPKPHIRILTQPRPQPDVPTAVQNLLLSTKSLQSSLSLWAQSRTTDAAVSDVYVQIGTAFNATIRAFSAYGIDLSDLHDIPTELRVVLEGCLAEEPSEEVLALYMPQVRKVIWKLLKGLQARQEVWRRLNGGV